MKEERGKEMANKMSQYVNGNIDFDEFVSQMNREHRTLQQSFTKLALKWIENVGSDEYRYDGRNEYAHKTCKELLKPWSVDKSYKPHNLPVI